jgi:hypothetical protein
MPASVISVTKKSQLVGGKPVYVAGKRLETFDSVNAWLAAKQKQKVLVRGIEGKILVEGIRKWQAYEEETENGTIVTVLEEHDEDH